MVVRSPHLRWWSYDINYIGYSQKQSVIKIHLSWIVIRECGALYSNGASINPHNLTSHVYIKYRSLIKRYQFLETAFFIIIYSNTQSDWTHYDDRCSAVYAGFLHGQVPALNLCVPLVIGTILSDRFVFGIVIIIYWHPSDLSDSIKQIPLS